MRYTDKENISGADALLASLINQGVETVFGYPGGSITPVYDRLQDYPELHHLLTRHEQGAVHAAQGYARVSNQTGVCMATSGPGATNLLTGIADAMLDSTPVVCIAAQVPAAALGTDFFQEADMINMTIPITKWNYQITRFDEIVPTIAKAFYVARAGRPGPVYIEITKNALVERCGVSRDKVTVIRNAVSRNFLSGEGKAIPLPAPNLVYLGTVAEWLDWETLRTYARRHPDVSLIFIGPGSPNIRRGMPRNMIFLPPVPHREICRYLRSADVLLLPFQVNELVSGVDPVKLYEYLSLNRPVVASYWEELDHFSRSGGIHFYRSPDDFESAAAKAFAAARTKLPPDEQFYRENLWEKRFPAFLALLDATGRVD